MEILDNIDLLIQAPLDALLMYLIYRLFTTFAKVSEDYKEVVNKLIDKLK